MKSINDIKYRNENYTNQAIENFTNRLNIGSPEFISEDIRPIITEILNLCLAENEFNQITKYLNRLLKNSDAYSIVNNLNQAKEEMSNYKNNTNISLQELNEYEDKGIDNLNYYEKTKMIEYYYNQYYKLKEVYEMGNILLRNGETKDQSSASKEEEDYFLEMAQDIYNTIVFLAQNINYNRIGAVNGYYARGNYYSGS